MTSRLRPRQRREDLLRPELAAEALVTVRARAIIEATVPFADYFLPSLEDARALTGLEDPEAIVDSFAPVDEAERQEIEHPGRRGDQRAADDSARVVPRCWRGPANSREFAMPRLGRRDKADRAAIKQTRQDRHSSL